MTEVLSPALPVEEQINQELVKANVTEAIIANLKEKYLPLKINGLEDKETYIQVKDARKECKGLRIMAEKICKKGREDAVAIQKAWVAKEKEVAGKIGEVEDYLESEEKGYEALVEKDKADRKRKQEEQFILRQAELSKMGVLYSDGSFALNDVSFELSIIKECDNDIWAENILPIYQAEYNKNEAERLRLEQVKAEREAEMKRQQEELEHRQRQLQEREAAIKKAEEEQLTKEQEEIKRKNAEAQAKADAEIKSRINQLTTLGLKFDFSDDHYKNFGCFVPMLDIKCHDSDQWNNLIEKITPHIELKKKEAEEKRLAEIEEQKRIAAEEATQKERERFVEEQRQEALRLRHEEQKKAEEMDRASDKEKWNDVLAQIAKVEIHEMRSGQYRKRAAILREKLEEIKAL